MLLIPRDDAKNGRPHRVPLCPIAEALINESAALDQESDFIFPSSVRDASLTPESATKAMGRMRAKGTVTDLRVHDLRRTAANGMRRLGVPKFIVSVTLNHVSATRGDVTVQHYLDEYAFEVEKTDALLKWGAKLEEILIGAGIMSSRLSTPVNGGNLGDADTFSTGVLTIQTPSDTIGASAKVGTRKPADSLAATAAVIQNPIRPIEAASKDTRDYHAESDHRQGRRFARTRRLRSGPRAVWEPVSRRAPQGSEHVHGANDTATDDCTD